MRFSHYSILSFLPALAPLLAGAAPTLTRDNMQVVGDVSTTMAIDTATLDSPGPAGAGVTWDFSGLGTTAVATKRYGLAPGATPYAAIYPSATHSERTVQSETQVDNYQFYIVTADSATVIGASGGVIDSTRYADPDVVMHLPFTYGDSIYDSASLTQYIHNGSHIVTQQGRTTVGDGYGALKLPNGTYSQALRYKVTLDQDIKVYYGSSVVSSLKYHVVEYFWADPEYQEFLLEYHPVMLKNGVQQYRSGIYWTDPKKVGSSAPTALSLPGGKPRAVFLSPYGQAWHWTRAGAPVPSGDVLGRAFPAGAR